MDQNAAQKVAMISIANLEAPYVNQHNERKFLKNINLNIQPGEIYNIIGKPESGKKELLRCINFTNQPSSGLITINQQNLNMLVGKKLRNMRRNISMLSKKPNLLSYKNVFENIALSLQLQNINKNDANRIVDPILHFTGLTNEVFLYPRQLTPMQKQLVSIARALVMQPKVLLCDDITNQLDVKSAHQVVVLLNKINKEFNITIVITSNDMEVIKNLSHKIGIMDMGYIVEECSSVELFANPKTEVAREFVRAAARRELPWTYRHKIRFQAGTDQNPIVRLSFTGCISPEYLLGQIIESYQCKINIIQAYKEHIQCQAINIILIEVELSPEDSDITKLKEALQVLQNNGLHSEILGYVTSTA